MFGLVASCFTFMKSSKILKHAHNDLNPRFLFGNDFCWPPWILVLQGSNQGPVAGTGSAISPFQYGDTPRSMGPTVDGGLWRASSSAVSPTAQQQSDGQLGSPTRGEFVVSLRSLPNKNSLLAPTSQCNHIFSAHN